VTGPALHGQYALVTGGGSGIGLACARWLLRDGATVTLAGRDPRRLAAGAAALARDRPDGAEVRRVVCDVTDEPAVAGAVEAAAGPDGLTIVVASAGVGWLAPIPDMPAATWRRVVETNLTGTFLTLKHAAPALRRAGGGAFTAISSAAGALAVPYLAAYGAAKAGVDSLVRTAADELGPFGIRVNSVQPGLVPTDMSADDIADAEILGEYLSNMPLGRVGRLDDVAAVVHFLSGPRATWITGVRLPVDGGHHLRRAPRFDPAVRRGHGGHWLPPTGAAG
jgi:NAD(P)-dependent dehydrogenase (short-subunit alcohol dehydrogenase family)